MNDDWTSSVRTRAQVHAALGDPARLSIVDRLLLGDVSPGELSRSLEMPTNLLAHHLKVLSEARVVERCRSEGDRRRTYLRLIPSTLTSLVPAFPLEAPRVVFVCTRNSARSQLAAALWASTSPVPVASAGTQPATEVHPRAVALARSHGLAIDPVRTTLLSDVVQPDDLVVAVCDDAHERLGREAGRHLHWSVPDPVRMDTDEAFDRAFRDISGRIDRLAPFVHPVRAIPAQ
ncbi:ArsR family transcriptional regulator [Sphaerisporangium dianthi]|uniref:ArsR family transcriptional regulator n=1 Tax=Sphaerisporangium dianthi TaxID=1436120 RepID=A0ABV9CIP9_9ACTN